MIVNVNRFVWQKQFIFSCVNQEMTIIAGI